MPIINVKGTHDIIGDEATLYSHIEQTMRFIAEQFAFLGTHFIFFDYLCSEIVIL